MNPSPWRGEGGGAGVGVVAPPLGMSWQASFPDRATPSPPSLPFPAQGEGSRTHAAADTFTGAGQLTSGSRSKPGLAIR